MHNARTANIPIFHLFAELTAYPLASEAAFRAAVTNLSPQMKEDTGGFWRKVEVELQHAFPFGIDELTHLRDFAWFGDERRALSLGEHLRSIADRCLERCGSVVQPVLPQNLRRPDSSGAAARGFWQWMSYALPPDLLLAAHSAGLPPCRHLSFVSPRLDQVLCDHGFAQLHLHFGAGSEFCDLWVGAQRALAHAKTQPSLFQSPGSSMGEGMEMAPWLLRAVLVRYLLAAFLVSHCAPRANFLQFIHSAVRHNLSATAAALLHGLLRELGAGRMAPETDAASRATYHAIRGLYARLTGVTVMNKLRHAVDIQALDPIACFFPASQAATGPTPEMKFTAAALAYMREASQPDDAFALLFWQIIRLRNLFYRHLVQRPLTPGLRWFFRFYDRLRAARAWGSRVQIESTAQLEGLGHGLRSLELRTAPDSTISEQLDLFREVEAAAASLWRLELEQAGTQPPERRLEIGLVLHFTRDLGPDSKKGMLKGHWAETYADPGYKSTGWRYSLYYQQRRRQALALGWSLQRFPWVLRVFRGLDICTDEVGVPTWVLVPLFRFVHSASHDAANYLREVYGHDAPPALRSTVHAGEDFPHLMGGLRRIAEVIEYLPLREADRIGHAIALGLDPHLWASQTGSLSLAKEERLFDLLWEWGWYSRQRVSPPHTWRVVYLESEIARLAHEIFAGPRDLAPYLLEKMLQDLHDPRMLRHLGFPSRRQRLHWQGKPDWTDHETFLRLFLTDPATFRRGRALEWVETASDADSLAAIQRELATQIGARGIVIEANPSSNFLVGDLRDLAQHPLWRLSPPRPGSATSPLSICLGSDDPVTFATNLREEYQKLLDAMVLSGLSQEEAERWLERIRYQGLTSRFTLPAWSENTTFHGSPRRSFTHLPLPP